MSSGKSCPRQPPKNSVLSPRMVFTKNVAPRWLFLFFGLLLGAPLLGHAQIVDDSTKVLYGPKTTRVIREADLQRDSTRGVVIDTSLVRWSQARFWYHDSTLQQDLGTVGSASRRLLYQPNLALGARLGRNVFDRFAREGSQVPFYDSRSPYSFFRYIQSSSGEQVFEITYSRSLGKNFSIGATYERIASNKIVGRGASQSEGLVEHNAAIFFARYQNDNERYHLLVSLVDTRHRASEQGGVLPLPGDTTSTGKVDLTRLLVYDRAQTNLSFAFNTDDRDELRLFHSYRLLGRGVTAYHIFDIRRQYNGYTDNDLVNDNGSTANIRGPVVDGRFYNYKQLNASLTADRVTYRQAENTFGLLGHTDRVEYNVYGRHRIASLRESRTPVTTAGPLSQSVLDPLDEVYNQVFFGGNAAFNYRTIYAVEVAGEYKPLGYNALGEYWLRGRIRTGPLSAEVLTSSVAPDLTQQHFVGNHNQWDFTSKDNKFSNTQTNQLTVRLQQRLPFLADHTLEASAAVANITNLIYYSQYPGSTQMQGPAQLTGNNANKQLLIGFARHRFRVGKVFVDNQGTYTQGGDGAGLRIPALVTESRLYYQTYVFKKALLGQVGGELYYQSRFRGYAYSPSTQQFYVQDYFTIRNYAVANVFLTADIKAATIFLKVAYVNQGLGSDGYFTTPYYIGYPRRFQFGVRWRFFT
jgi:hypothetical protein